MPPIITVQTGKSFYEMDCKRLARCWTLSSEKPGEDEANETYHASKGLKVISRASET